MTTPPTKAPEQNGRRASSIVIVNTGDGKGKTTAAMGTVLRSLARGWRVLVVQFVKSGNWNSGEVRVLTNLGAEWWTRGDGFSWEVEDLDHSADLAFAAWSDARDQIMQASYDLVLLDEITYPMNWGWIETAEVVETIRSRPKRVSVILTGRSGPEELIAVADTVTEMRNVRHAFDRGIRARRGIDY